MRKISLFLAGLLVVAPALFACPATAGKSSQDKSVAKRLCGYEAFDALKDSILLTGVNSSILDLDITPALYRGLSRDRATARLAIGNLSRIFQKEAATSPVTPPVLCEQDQGDIGSKTWR